jgi:hypothetical protein
MIRLRKVREKGDDEHSSEDGLRSKTPRDNFYGHLVRHRVRSPHPERVSASVISAISFRDCSCD